MCMCVVKGGVGHVRKCTRVVKGGVGHVRKCARKGVCVLV